MKRPKTTTPHWAYAMHPSQIEASLDAFLSGDDRVMVIRGAWGVGKSYFWSAYVARRVEAQSLSQVAYSYVSLFGKSSLLDIRASIFQAGRPIAKDEAIRTQFDKEYQASTGLLKNAPWLRDAQEKLTAKARLAGWLTDLARSTPFTDKYSRLIASLEYRLVNNYLICIDDLERKGAGLSIREVMGLIDELANQKSCKIVLIFNDVSLTEGRDKEEFDEYREKVVDSEVEYNPTHSQAIACAFSEDQPYFDRVRQLAQTLDIKNIRVLRKLKRVIDAFWRPLDGADSLISSEFINHATVLVWSHYMRKEALPYDFILSRVRGSSWAGYFRNKDEDIPADEKRYRELAQQISLSPSVYTDLVADYLARGYVDISAVDAVTKQLALKIAQQRAHAELNSIWRMFSDSFADNEAEIRDRFLRTLNENSENINVSEFSAAVDMLQTLGVDVEILMTRYVTLHAEQLSGMDPDDAFPARRVSFDPLRKKIAELSIRRSNPNIDEVAKRIMNRGWNKGDFEYLASLTEPEVFDWMRSDPEDLPGKIRGALLFSGQLTGASEEDTKMYKKIYDTTVAALRRIASSSELNRRRVATIYDIPEDD